MGELLRLHQVDAQREGEAPLVNCSLDLADGEILFVMGDRRSGIHLLFSMLAGNGKSSNGRLYFHEERLRDGSFAGCPFLAVDNYSKMTGSLTIHSNLRSLGGKKEEIGSAQQLRILLLTLGIESSPWRLTSECPAREQILLWFALAILRKDSMICLDLSEISFSEEDFRILRQAVNVCQLRGIAVVLMDSSYNPLTEIAGRIAWMRSGRVIKTFFRKEDFPAVAGIPSVHFRQRVVHTREGSGREVLHLSLGETGRRSFREEKEIVLGEGDIWILFDSNWPLHQSLPDYLRIRFGKKLLPAGEYQDHGVIYIPEDSHQYLMEEAGIGKNIMMTVSQTAGVRLGFIQKNMETFLETEFRHRFDIPEETEQAGELTPSQKKYLTIYRAALLRPQILLLENPLFVFDESQREEAAAYLKEIAAAGRTVIVSLKTPEEMDMF